MSVRCEDQCYLGGGGEDQCSLEWGRGEKAVPQQELHLQGSAVEIPGVVRQPEGVFVVCISYLFFSCPDLYKTILSHLGWLSLHLLGLMEGLLSLVLRRMEGGEREAVRPSACPAP